MSGGPVTLGDAGTSNTDVSYGGASGDASMVSPDYYRQKIVQFQQVLDAADQAYQAANAALVLPGLDEQTATELAAEIADYDSRRTLMKTTAEALNLGAAAINAAGGRMPVLSIPQTLGLGPVLPAVALAALATAVVLIQWGPPWTQSVSQTVQRAQLLDAASTPEARDQLAQIMAQADGAAAAASSSPLSIIAGPVKWVAFGLLAWIGWKALGPMLKGSGHQD